MLIEIGRHRILIKKCEKVYPPEEDTFLIIDTIKEWNMENMEILEVGAGTGLISIICAKKGAKVTATDIKEESILCTKMNAWRNNVKIEVKKGNLFEPVEGRKFDLIIFNPPYLPSDNDVDKYLTREDKLDLVGGFKGNEIAIKFVKQLKKFLKRNGKALLIQSTLSNPRETMKTAEKYGLKTRIINQKKFFFETIYLLELIPCTEQC